MIDAVNRMGAQFDSHAAITEAAPQARYVRAFDTLGWENFASRQRRLLFFAADDAARPAAEELIRAVG